MSGKLVGTFSQHECRKVEVTVEAETEEAARTVFAGWDIWEAGRYDLGLNEVTVEVTVEDCDTEEDEEAEWEGDDQDIQDTDWANFDWR